MNNNIIFGQYYNSNSWVHRLDPRVKIISVILFMIMVFLIDNIYFICGILAFTMIIILSTRIPFGKFLRSLRMLTFLLLFMFVFQVLFRKTGDLIVEFDFTLTIFNLITIVVMLALYFLSSKIIKKGRFLLFLLILIGAFVIQVFWTNGIKIVDYQINVYDDSLITALFVFLRIITILLISSLLTLSTKPMELNLGLEKLLSPLKKLKVNVSIFTMMVSIALRYIPTLINEANKILKAQASRGVDFKESSFKDKITQIISLIVPMFVIAYKRALDLSDAMEARGYDPDKERTSINVLKMNFIDIFCISFLIVGLISIIILKIIYGI